MRPYRYAFENMAQRPDDDIRRQYLSRFPWIKGRRNKLLCAGIAMGTSCRKAGTMDYFWMHLARIVETAMCFEQAIARLAGNGPIKILDLGASDVVAAFLAQGTTAAQFPISMTCSTTSGEHFHVESSLGIFDVETQPVLFREHHLPFASASFDLVILGEVLEHIERHPQFAMVEVARVLRPGGGVLLTTPNISSWKKILALSNGDWGFDSSTFGGEWSHRYEYSYYQMRQILIACGFDILEERARDVYFDDPEGVASALQLAALCAAKAVCGHWRTAAKLWLRRGSGLFFVAEKRCQVSSPSEEDLIRV